MKQFLLATTCCVLFYDVASANEPSTFPPQSTMQISSDGSYNVNRNYSPATYTDSTSSIQVQFTISPQVQNVGAIQTPYITEMIELGINDPNNLNTNLSADPITYHSGTRVLVNPNSCVRSGVDNRTLTCNAAVSFPADLRTGDSHMLYIRYYAASPYTANNTINWEGYYTNATLLQCSPQPACFTMGQPTPTTLTTWPNNSETNPLMPDFIDANGNFIFDFDFSGMLSIPLECQDPLDPAYDIGFCEDICTQEPWTINCLGPSWLFFVDPPIATGYEYSVMGTTFTSVKAPSLSTVNDPDGYTLRYGGITEQLDPGESHTFPTSVSNFTIEGITPSLQIGASDTDMFPLGVSLEGISEYQGPNVQIKQSPIVTNFSLTPSVTPSTSSPFIYPPASFDLDANGSDPNGSALQYNWTGTNLSASNIENPTVNFTSAVTSPTTQSYSVTATNTDGLVSSAGAVDVKLLPKPCLGWSTQEFQTFLPVTTSSLNGNFTVKANRNALEQDLTSRFAQVNGDDPGVSGLSYMFEVRHNSLPVSTMDKAGAEFDGTFITRLNGLPATDFWDGQPLSVDQWYEINVGLNASPNAKMTELSDPCRLGTMKFRLPSIPQSTNPTVNLQRPMEIQDAGGSISTVMIPIQAKKVIAVGLVDRDVVSTGGSGVGVAVGVVGGDHRPLDGTETTNVLVPKEVKTPVPTGPRGVVVPKNKTLEPEDKKKEEPKKKRLPWRR